MARTTTNKPAADLDLDALESKLADALVAGGDTLAIRAEINRLRADADIAAATAAARAADFQRAEAERIARNGAVIAAAATDRIGSLLDDLQPPPVPC